jgi:hypothetical protein
MLLDGANVEQLEQHPVSIYLRTLTRSLALRTWGGVESAWTGPNVNEVIPLPMKKVGLNQEG